MKATFTRLLVALSLGAALRAQSPAALAPSARPAPEPAFAIAGIDPLEPPEELAEFARRATLSSNGVPQKLQALLSAFFRSQDSGGLGIQYDDSRTRTLREVWQDHKANCLGLTALFVAATRSLGIETRYAEPVNTGHWTRREGLIRYERHLVAIAPVPPLEDLVADFLPQVQHRRGHYVVATLTEGRVRALWASNRAVESLLDRNLETAEAFATSAIRSDPDCPVGWNTLGVIHSQRRDSDRAEACYRKALSLDPRDATVIGNMEALLRNEGRWEESVRYRLLGLELRKRDPYFHAFLAEEAMYEGRIEDALKSIKAAIRLQPYDPEFYALEAGLRVSLGKLNEAQQSLELAKRWADPRQRQRFDNKLAALKQAHG